MQIFHPLIDVPMRRIAVDWRGRRPPLLIAALHGRLEFSPLLQAFRFREFAFAVFLFGSDGAASLRTFPVLPEDL